MAAAYKSLDPFKIVDTAHKLQARIAERFPESSLGRLAGELHQVAVETSERIAWIQQPLLFLRVVATIVLIGIPLLIVVVELLLQANTDWSLGITSLADFITTLEAFLGSVVFLGAAIFFVSSFEGRVKRNRVLAALHELRSMAHIIDMHQLTKDPERVLGAYVATRASPKVTLTPFELVRYFDYCSEMLALISKVAALYIQGLQDSDAVSAVDEIEALTTGLSRKIWQKIMLVERDAASA